MERKQIIELMLSKLERDTDKSWEDISKETGLNFSDSHIRKMAYGVRFYDDYIKENNRNDVIINELDSIDEKMIELKKTRQQLSDERTLTNKKIRNLARVEDFVKLLKDELELIAYEKPMTLETDSMLSITDGNIGVMLLSDIHYGIEINDICGNSYNPDIAKERMTYLKDRIIEYCKEQNVTTLHINCLGDVISGHIHNTIRLENRINVVEQIVGIAEILSTFLYDICKEIPKVHFYSVEGNHDRVLPKKEDNLNKDSFNILIKELITQRTKDIDNLVIDKTKENYIEYDVLDSVCVGVHGDKDKINNIVKGLEAITGKKIDYVFTGHYHNANEYTDNQSEIIVNGSFSGVDEYAYNLRKNSKPIQKFMIFDKNGRKCTYNIDVSLKNK